MVLAIKPSKINLIFFAAGVFSVGVLAGFIVKGKLPLAEGQRQSCNNELAPVRLSGYKFINPLLICDATPNKEFSSMSRLKEKLNGVISQGLQKNKVTEISVYFQNLDNSERIEINGDENFFPASLGKIPMMIAYFKMAETNPSILDEKIKYEGGTDYNTERIINAGEAIKAGESYTVEELIEKMIKYSDNNALYLLTRAVDPAVLDALYKSVYEDLQVPITGVADQERRDFLTPRQISFFFRALYNGTYLTKKASEKALEILSQTDFNDGLMKGFPKGIVTAHKFGLYNVFFQGKMTGREMHDCGIIYHPKSPYLLCVMTKSSSPISDIEDVIGNISKLVYQEVSGRY